MLYLLVKNKEIIKKIEGVQYGVSSPNCKYYYYIAEGGAIVVKNEKDLLMCQFKSTEEIDYFQWSLNSEYIYLSEFVNDITNVYRCWISNGKKELIFSQTSSFHPVPVNDPNILYMLKNISDDNYEVVKYNIETKKYQTIKLPIDKPQLFDNFTVSPDEKTIVFSESNTQSIYFVDLKTQKILDKKKIITPGYYAGNFYWKADSSYLLFAISPKEVYKYTVPKD